MAQKNPNSSFGNTTLIVKELFKHCLIALCISQLIFPPHIAYSQGGEDVEAEILSSLNVLRNQAAPGSDDENSPVNAALRVAHELTQEGMADGKLDIGLDQQTADFGLLDQNLVYRGNTYGLGGIDVRKPDIVESQDKIRRSSYLEVLPNAFAVRVEGSDAMHVFNLLPGEDVKSWTRDSEFLIVLTDKGRMFALPLTGLNHGLFSSKIFVPLLGIVQPDILAKIDRIAFLSNRPFDPSDKREDQLSRLSGDAKYMAYQAAVATPVTAGKMRAKLESIRIDGIAPGVSRSVVDFCFSGDLIILDKDRKVLKAPFNRAVIGERVADQIRLAADVQMDFLRAQQIAELSQEHLKKAVAAANAGAAMDPTERRAFSWESFMGDLAGYERVVAEAESVAASNEAKKPGFLRRLKESWARGRGVFSPKSLNKLETILKRGATVGAVLSTGAAADVTLNNAQVSTLASQMLAASSDWLVRQFPVFSSGDYVQTLGLSMAYSASLPILIMAAYSALAPLTHYGAGDLLIKHGIKSYAYFRWVAKYPVAVMAQITKQTHALKAWSYGVVTGPLFRKKTIDQVNAKANGKRAKDHMANFIALKVLASAYGESPREYIEGLKNPNTEESAKKIAQLAELSTQLRSRLDNNYSDDAVFYKAVSAKDKSAVNLDSVVNEATTLAKELMDHPMGSFERWMSHAKNGLLNKFVKSMGQTGDAQIFADIHADPSGTVVRMTLSSWLVDYYLTIATSAVAGDWADLKSPENLRAQAGNFLWTSGNGHLENVYDIIAHLMAGAAANSWVYSSNAEGVNADYAFDPETEFGDDLQKKYRTNLQELAVYLKTLANLRNFEGIEAAVSSMVKAKLFNLRAALLFSMIPRMLCLGQDVSQAFLGSFNMIFLAIFTYAWPWYLWLPLYDKVDSETVKKYELFKSRLGHLQNAINQQDKELTNAAIEDLLRSYRESADFNYEEALKPLKSQLVESKNWQDIGRDFIEFARANPPVAAGTKSSIVTLMLTFVGMTTTYMATYVYSNTALEMNYFNVVLPDIWSTAEKLMAAYSNGSMTQASAEAAIAGSQFLQSMNLVTGIPEMTLSNGTVVKDGAFSIAAKSLMMFYTAYWLTKKFKSQWDKFVLANPRMRASIIAEGRLEEIEARLVAENAALKAVGPIHVFRNTFMRTLDAVLGPKRADIRSENIVPKAAAATTAGSADACGTQAFSGG